MLVAILIGFASAAVCFMALLLLGLSVPLVLSCAAAVGCAIFLLALSVVKLASTPKRGRYEDEDTEEVEDSFEPPKVVTLKSKSPEQLDREKRERLIRELEEKNKESQRRIAALKKRGER